MIETDDPAGWDAQAVGLLMDPHNAADPEVVHHAIDLLRRAVDGTPVGHANRPGYLSNLGLAVLERFGWTDDRSDLDEAIELIRSAVTATPADDPDRAIYLSNLGNALRTRHEWTDELADLDEAIEVGRQAVAAPPPDTYDPQGPGSNLGLALLNRFQRLGELSDLDEAVELLRHAATDTPADHDDRSKHLHNLANALRIRFERTGSSADLDEAVTVGRTAASETPDDHPLRSMVQTGLCLALRDRYERAGLLADLHESIAVARTTLAQAESDDHHRAPLLSALGMGLSARFDRLGKLADLDEAISVLRQAVDETPDDHPSRRSYLLNLSSVLSSRFDRLGEPADLDEAIDVMRRTVAGAPPDHPDLSLYLNNLGNALRTRYDHAGDLTDLDDAVTVGRHAVDATPDGDARLAMLWSNLSLTLHTRFDRLGEPADLDEAVDAGRRAVAATPDGHTDVARYSSNLCGALRERFERSGELADLDEAVAAGRRGVAATPDDHPDLAMHLSNLGLALRQRSDHTGEPADLDEAVQVQRRAVAACPADYPTRAGCLTNLGIALLARWRRTGHVADHAPAMAAFAECLDLITAAPVIRERAGREWAELAAGGGDWATAARAYDATVAVLPQLVDRRIGPESRQHHVANVDELGSDAAAATLQATGDPARALAVLEQGRGLLLTQGLDTRTDLRTLRRAHPDLADEADRLRRLLNADTGGWTAGSADVVRQRRAIAAEWEQLLARVRGLDGFRGFLRPPAIADLAAAAAGGAVVALNVSRYRCDALILTPDGVDLLPLLALAQDEAANQATVLLNAVHHSDGPDVRAMAPVLSWLWDTVAGPVLDRLGHMSRPVAGEPWPRVWWVPTGPLAVLPIHAAGHGRPDEDSVLDRVVSSYVPTIRALHHARRQRTTASGRPLIAAVSQAPDEAPLWHANREARLVADHLGVAASDILDEARAGKAAVLAHLGQATWAHFVCHAQTDSADPADSYLALHDQPLRVRELSTLDLQGAHLAYLSSCTTAFGGTRLLDEAIHVASAFQLAGFAHVVGTLWPVTDRSAVRFAELVYPALVHGVPPAQAVHDAIRRLREGRHDYPYLWASHIHIGP